MSQTSILAAIAAMKSQIATLERLLRTVETPAPAKDAEPAKVKKVLSPEHLAKLKAGAEAAREKKKNDAQAAAGGGSSASSVASAPHESDAESSTSSQKRRGPKKLSEMSASELEAHKAKIAANAALSPEEKAAKKAAAAAKKEAAAAKKASKEAKA
jgi:colicin import membrane protein